MSKPKKQRLGRGLSALLGDGALEQDERREEGLEEPRRLPVDVLSRNPFQPRREFREAELDELADSIRENGLLQPLVVRPDPDREGRYQLVAGERRLRAVGRLGWKEVTVIVRQVDDRTLVVLALVENIQREALGPLEEAEGYRALVEDFELTQGEVAEAVGKNRATVANMFRLLGLPPSVRRFLEAGELQMGHARALLAVEDPVRMATLARKAVQEGWSVREVERRARSAPRGAPGKKARAAEPGAEDPVFRALEEELEATLGTRVRLRGGKGGKGRIEIPFQSVDDFDRIFSLITGRASSEVAS